MRDYKYEDFLRPFKLECDEEYEVSKASITLIWKNYKCYDENGYTVKEKRRQKSTEGCCLSRGDRTLDISADILTAISAFSENEDKEYNRLYQIFLDIYHSCGNVIPICEGGNLGGGVYKNGESSDHFYRKLNMTKGFFESDKKAQNVFKNEDPTKIGRNRKELIRFWVKNENLWKNKSWGDFVSANYLEDFVDKNLEVKKLVFGKNNKETLEETIKLIIRRGYRIDKQIHGKFNEHQEKECNNIISRLMD